MKKEKFKPTRELVNKINKLLSHGLSHGLGIQEPGKMCVEAVICHAMGLPHGDNPPCVGSAVRSFKIKLNDLSGWSSPKARANGLARLAIAQLGSDSIDQSEFSKRLAKLCIQRIVPIGLRAAAKSNPIHAAGLLAAALKCETEGTRESAKEARAYASAAYASAASAAYYAAASASAAAATTSAAYFAYSAAASADDARSDNIYGIIAEAAVEVLIELKSPGCKFLTE